MGLFDLFKKNKQSTSPAAPKPKKRGKRPETYEELVDDLLNNTDRELLYEDLRMLSATVLAQDNLSTQYDMMSGILEKAVEAPRAEVTYEFLTEHMLGQYRMYLGEQDPTYIVPLKTLDRFNEAVVALYRQCGEKQQERMEYYSTQLYNIPCCGVRKLYELMMEDNEKREDVLQHLIPIQSEDVLFFLLDYIAARLDDPADEQLKEIRDFIKENLHAIVLFNTGEIISDNSVKDVPEFFRRIYLKICDRENDKELIARFNAFWES